MYTVLPPTPKSVTELNIWKIEKRGWWITAIMFIPICADQIGCGCRIGGRYRMQAGRCKIRCLNGVGVVGVGPSSVGGGSKEARVDR